jgi:hypothetical protein
MLHIHPSSGAGTIGQLVADVPSGLSLTAHDEIKKLSVDDVTVCDDAGPLPY